MTDTQRLLADYVNNGSEAAFRDLVARYLDLVYSTAVRLAGGDTHLAQDIAQTVFVGLARHARKLSGEVRLGGWLHRHTCFVAANTLRGERRRQSRERQALEMNATPDHSEVRLGHIAPILDDAINQLGAADRAAVVLRFYEQLDFRSVGEVLGTTEAAAQKRVTRALEKLQTLLKHRGVTLSAVALGAALATQAVSAAPAGLVAGISATALAGASAGTGTTLTFLKYMAATKLQTSIITAVIIASIVTPLVMQHQAQAGLHAQDDALQRQTAQLSQLTTDNQRLEGLVAESKKSPPLADAQFLELLRLRSEVGRLRKDVHEMAAIPTTPPAPPEDQLASMKKMYSARVDQLKQWFEANPSEQIPGLQSISDTTWLNSAASLNTDDDLPRAASNLRNNADFQALGRLGQALRKYAAANNGQFPTDLSQLTPFLKSPMDDALLQHFEIVPANSLVSKLQPGGDWVITQKTAANPALDMRFTEGLTGNRNADVEVTNRWTSAP